MQSVTPTSELRRSERRSINLSLRVFDGRDQEPLGKLINLSLEGFMLVSPNAFEANHLLRLSLELPYEIEGARRVSVHAWCVWCQKSSFSNSFGAGFEIREIAPGDRRRLAALYGTT